MGEFGNQQDDERRGEVVNLWVPQLNGEVRIGTGLRPFTVKVRQIQKWLVIYLHAQVPVSWY